MCKRDSSATLPTRVIEVGSDGGQDPCLVESNGQLGSYVALSYCWGDSKKHPVLKTTWENFDAHKRNIPLASMPKTILDAVKISRRLGIPFLWVDALCIIQGDAADWAREAGKMCEVYSNATLTIAADHADGNSVGILGPQAYGEHPRELSLNGRSVYIRNELGRSHNDVTVLLRLPDAEGEHTEPINKRAWTLQEAILSNRVLHYTSNEMVWECNEVRECECRQGCPVVLDEESTRMLRSPELFGSISIARAYLQWRQIVQLFTERQLSYDEDRLSALSGMAKQFAQMRQAVIGVESAYFAGIWEDDLAVELLWLVEDDYWRNRMLSYRMPHAWRAPSWSWAAVEAPVMFHIMSAFQTEVKLVCAKSEPLDARDPFGRVKSAEIVLSGKVVHGLTVKTSRRKDGEGDMGFVDGIKYQVVDQSERSCVVIFDDSNSIGRTSERYSCLRIGTASVQGADRSYSGFIVMRRVGASGYMFERVGASSRGGDWTTAADIFAEADEETVTLR
jgi:hypothetical protein